MSLLDTVLQGFYRASRYALSHLRPIHEIMSPCWKPMDEIYQYEFKEMTREAIALDELMATRGLSGYRHKSFIVS